MNRPHSALSIAARQILRLLTAEPAAPEHVDIALVCDIGEVSRGVALHLLHELDVAGFANQIDLGQWRLYADPEDTPDPAYAARMIVWTIERAAQADTTIRPYSRREAPLAKRLRATTFASPDDAMRWFEATRPRLLRLLHALVGTARYTCAWQLGEALWGLSRCAGWHADALTRPTTHRRSAGARVPQPYRTGPSPRKRRAG